jgi:hypothetical protein
VYKDFVSGEEFFSDAKDIEAVTVDGKDTGLVRTKAYKQTAGGAKIDVGGGNAFGGGGEDEGADDAEETKWDQFWNFPAIEVRVLRCWLEPCHIVSSPRCFVLGLRRA